MVVSRPPIQALLLDLSGTLHVGSTPTPGAVEALTRLRRYNLAAEGQVSASLPDVKRCYPFRFCSNTSKEGRRELEERLRSMGFEILVEGEENGVSENDREMWTSLGALSSLLHRKGLQRPFCFLQESAKQEVLRDIGEADDPSQRYDCVVVGLAPDMFTYENLNTAFRILLPSGSSPAKPLIATHRAKYVRTGSKNASSDGEHDTLSLGPGPFVAALETATGVHAEVVGKPSMAFFETVVASFGLESEGEGFKKGRIAIIGDDIETDLGGAAVELGFWRVLVKTGKYRPGDEHRPGVVPPDEVCDSFAAFIDSLLKHSEE